MNLHCIPFGRSKGPTTPAGLWDETPGAEPVGPQCGPSVIHETRAHNWLMFTATVGFGHRGP